MSRAARDAAFLAGQTTLGARSKSDTVEQLSKRADLIVGVSTVCRLFQGSVTSWWRSKEHNASLAGSAPNSLHLYGLACDVIYDARPSLGEVTAVVSQHGLRVRREDDHDHIEAVLA